MQIIDAGFEIIHLPQMDELHSFLEMAARTCYKSEKRSDPVQSAEFVHQIIRSGHESVIEHATATVKFIVDRGVSHELVRHRLAAYSQESTRYCNYSSGRFDGEITFIRPCFWDVASPQYMDWKLAMEKAEGYYMLFMKNGATPQQARSVLPQSVKTEVVATMNMRQWRHVLAQRTSKAAHPQMREVMFPLLCDLALKCPVLFKDVCEKANCELPN